MVLILASSLVGLKSVTPSFDSLVGGGLALDGLTVLSDFWSVKSLFLSLLLQMFLPHCAAWLSEVIPLASARSITAPCCAALGP
jgi:hypothetical protein